MGKWIYRSIKVLYYKYKYYVVGHYPSSCIYKKKCRPVYVTKHNVSETVFCLRLQVKRTELSPIDRARPYLRTPVSAPRWDIQAKYSTNNLRELTKHQFNKMLHVWGLAPGNYHDRNHRWREEILLMVPLNLTWRSCSSFFSLLLW
jgi:hypothetical protein